MKFLSVDCTMASTRPLRHAAVTSWHRAADWTPYALLTMCAMPCLLHSLACRTGHQPSHQPCQLLLFGLGGGGVRTTSTSMSGPRGAKQLAVVTIAATLPAPRRAIPASSAAMSVRTCSAAQHHTSISSSHQLDLAVQLQQYRCWVYANTAYRSTAYLIAFQLVGDRDGLKASRHNGLQARLLVDAWPQHMPEHRTSSRFSSPSRTGPPQGRWLQQWHHTRRTGRPPCIRVGQRGPQCQQRHCQRQASGDREHRDGAHL